MMRLQFHFLINRVSLAFLLLSGILLTGAYLYASRFWEGMGVLDANRAEGARQYAEEALAVGKFVLVATGLFLNLHCFLGNNGRYAAFFVTGPRERIRFLSGKLVMIGFLLLGMAIHAGLSFFVVFRAFTPYDFPPAAASWFLSLWGEACLFGLLQAFLMQAADSVFSGIPPLVLFWFLAVNEAEAARGTSGILRLPFELFSHLLPVENGFRLLGDPLLPAAFGLGLFALNLAWYRFRDVK